MATPDASAAQIAAWIGSPAEHAQAADTIAALGDAAIPALLAYLAHGPEVIPQPRCFAVAMLARLPANAATEGLRSVLHKHPLAALPATIAEAEYVVKSDALDALCRRAYAALAGDVVFGVSQRLRTAVAAAGRLQLRELADALVDLLDDDVLAEAAMESLATLGADTSTAIMPRLDAWLTEAALSARRRLALIRALRVLRRVHCGKTPAIRRALDDSHPAVCAAAALLVWPERNDAATVAALLHGAVGFDRGLADDCRTALDSDGVEPNSAVEQALQRDAEPDLYGEIHSLSSEQHDWLVACSHRANLSRP